MMEIRPVRKTDKKRLLKMVTHFFKKQRNTMVPKKLLPIIRYKNYEKHLREDVEAYVRLKPKEAVIFVAEDGDELIGYIYGRVLNRPKKVLSKAGVIEDWFVEENYRGKGIGAMLWRRLIRWFKNKGCACLEINAYTKNKHAINIYRKMGFIENVIEMTKKI